MTLWRRGLTASIALAALIIGSSSINDARADEKLVIGAAVAMTGWLAPYDAPVIEGLKLGVGEINAAGGIDGRIPIELVVKDQRTDTAQGVIVTQEFIDAGVNVLIVPCDSSAVHALGGLILAAQIPAFSTCSSSPTLAVTGGDYVFANAPADNLQATVSAVYARDQGYETGYIFFSPDIEYTILPKYFSQVFAELGGTMLGEGSYALSQQDFSAEVAKIKALDPQPDVIYTAAFEPDFPAFLRTLRAVGIESAVIAADGIDSPTTLALGELAEGVVFTSSGVATPGSRLEAFEDMFEEATGARPETIFNAAGYDLATIIKTAVMISGSTDPKALQEAIVNMVDVQGVTSNITYKGMMGIQQRSVALVKVSNGQKVLIKDAEVDPALIPAPIMP